MYMFSDDNKLEEYENQGIIVFKDTELDQNPGLFMKVYTNYFYDNEYKGIEIYDCEKSNCYKTSGYININNNKVIECDNNGCREQSETKYCSSSSHVGKASIKNSEFNICIRIGNWEYTYQKINYGINYIFSLSNFNDNDIFTLYKSNDSGNVIAIAMTGKQLLINFNII